VVHLFFLHNQDDLSWFSLVFLPDNIIPDVRSALESYQNGIMFSEFGWCIDSAGDEVRIVQLSRLLNLSLFYEKGN
jgi:hypothetical protein